MAIVLFCRLFCKKQMGKKMPLSFSELRSSGWFTAVRFVLKEKGAKKHDIAIFEFDKKDKRSPRLDCTGIRNQNGVDFASDSGIECENLKPAVNKREASARWRRFILSGPGFPAWWQRFT